jgi:hypothetical protein
MALQPKTAALIGVALFIGLTAEIIYKIAKVSSEETTASAPTPPATPPVPAIPDDPALPKPKVPFLQGRIEALQARMEGGNATPEELAQLEKELLTANPHEAIAAMRGFLETGQDARTGQDFVVGEKGELAGSPTLRVKLLDILGRISRRSGGADAANQARTVLETKDSADEWAISMRNIGWTQPGSQPYLVGKMREMLSHQPWLAEPSGGMLEAFDVAVFTRDASLVEPLAALAAGDHRPLQRAASVALERMSESAPLEVMNLLNSKPQTMAERPFIRADFFAKADLSVPAQRQAVESYLSRRDVSVQEKSKFLKMLATPASFVSDNLLTQSAPPVTDDSARTALVSKVTQEWIQSPRFPELKGAFQQLSLRLQR